MYATIRSYEGVDETRLVEITKKANESLIPRLSELPGFSGYFLFEPANGVLTSISLFETTSNLDESSRIAAKVLQDEDLQRVMPNPPRITSGKLMRSSGAASGPSSRSKATNKPVPSAPRQTIRAVPVPTYRRRRPPRGKR